MEKRHENSNELNNSMNNHNNTFTFQNNQQCLEHKNKIIQAQDLKLLNDNQGRALAALECYANRFCNNNEKTKYFDYYNMNNLGNRKDISQLRGQCIVQTQLFRMNYIDYIKNYTVYKIDNINNGELLAIIQNWMNKVNYEDKIIYQEMIDIINSSTNAMPPSSSNSFNHYSKNCQNATMDPKEIACIAPGVYNYNHQSSKDAKKKYFQTGKMNSYLIIGQSYKDDKNAQILMNQIEGNMQYYWEQEDLRNNGYT